MRGRIGYTLAVLALILSASLVVWQGSFSFGEYAPASPVQTTLYWAVSTLVFLLTVTLGFMLFRTAVKLYIERRSNQEGSRIKTKLLLGALALTFLPMTFLVLWSVSVLNYNLNKWFSRPTEGVRQHFAEVLATVDRDARELAEVQASWLAAVPEVQAGQRIDRLCKERRIPAAAIERAGQGLFPLCGAPVDLSRAARVPLASGGSVLVGIRPRLDTAESRRAVSNYIRDYDLLALDRRSMRKFYLLLLAVITLFILFFATWIALFLAKQISNPISALLEAAGEVRKGNLYHRVQTFAIDELGSLVRAFNEMTDALESNSRELERRRRFTEAILESIPSGVISIAADGRILRVNRALKNLFGEERAAGAYRLEDLFTRDDTADLRYMMKRARRTGAASRQMELKIGGRTLHLSATIAALEEKLTSAFVLVLEDTTDILRAQKLAAWQEVARRIAHEIKNPLTPIALCGDRIARQVERTPMQPQTAQIIRECTDTIANEVEAVKTLVNAFSQFARFPTAQPVPSNLNEAVEAALAVFAGRLEEIDIERDLAPDLPAVNIDRELFKRVVVNLVDNAAESMHESPLKRLYISTHATGADTIELIIADTGRGISPEDKDRLFLPYFSTKGRGTGLGLAIASQILAEHGASIRVDDNAPQGARFVIEVPALGVDTEAHPQEARA
ncbi:MAG TPA: ATP-binding protein [Bryobacteraceae bacterium]|nr:ATP-binding protein [Bryobacteraceae bacterium]